MPRYILSRVVQLVPTIFGIYTLAFVLMRVLPGDPASFLVGFRKDEQALADVRRAMHLKEPVTNQYVAFLQNALQGDMGRSYLTRQPVTDMIADAFPSTVILALSAMTFAIVIGLPLGMLSAIYK